MAKTLFPYSMAATRLTGSITKLIILAALAQCPLYGVIIGVGAALGRGWHAVVAVAIANAVAMLAARFGQSQLHALINTPAVGPVSLKSAASPADASGTPSTTGAPMQIPRPSLTIPLAVLVLLSLGSCADRKVDGEVVTYSFKMSVILGAAVGCVVGAAVGWVLRGWSARLGWGLVIICPLLLVGMVPGLATDYVRIDANGFECRYGFWFAPKQHAVRFAELREIRWVETERRTRRGGRQIDIDLLCLRKDGGQQKVDLGDLMKQAVNEILQRADARGVPVVE